MLFVDGPNKTWALIICLQPGPNIYYPTIFGTRFSWKNFEIFS